MRTTRDPGSPRSQAVCLGACLNTTIPSLVTFEEALSRFLSRDGSCSAGHRGPDSGSRRFPAAVNPSYKEGNS